MKRHMAIWAMQYLCNARHRTSNICKINWLDIFLVDN